MDMAVGAIIAAEVIDGIIKEEDIIEVDAKADIEVEVAEMVEAVDAAAAGGGVNKVIQP